MRKGWESWGCSTCRREESRETLELLPVPKELERDFGQGMECQDKAEWCHSAMNARGQG